MITAASSLPADKPNCSPDVALSKLRVQASHRISVLATQISAIAVEVSKLELAVTENGDVSTARQKLAAVVAAAV